MYVFNNYIYIIQKKGHCGCWGSNPNSEVSSLINPRDVNEFISLKPAGRRKASPNRGSDKRVSLYRLCPQDHGCRDDKCHNHNSGELALSSFGYSGGSGSNTPISRHLNDIQDVLDKCLKPLNISWCVGVHACSGSYNKPTFNGGKGL